MKSTTKDFFRQLSQATEGKVDNSEKDVRVIRDNLKQPNSARLTLVDLDEKLTQHTNIIVESITPQIPIKTDIVHCRFYSLTYSLLIDRLIKYIRV